MVSGLRTMQRTGRTDSSSFRSSRPPRYPVAPVSRTRPAACSRRRADAPAAGRLGGIRSSSALKLLFLVSTSAAPLRVGAGPWRAGPGGEGRLLSLSVLADRSEQPVRLLV